MIDRIAEYTNIISRYEIEKKHKQKLQKPLPIIRLFLFLISIFAFYIYVNERFIAYGLLSIILFIVFVYLSFYDSNLKRSIRKLNLLIGLNENELKAIDGNYSMFENGGEFQDSLHDYSHDLDLFGQGSVFQYVNRTATLYGKQRLAHYFNHAYSLSEWINKRQQAIKELVPQVELRQNLRLIFHNEPLQQSDKDELTSWIEGQSPIKNLKLLRVLAYFLPAITIIGIGLSVFGLITFPSYLIVLQLFIVFWYGKKTIKVQNTITSKSKILSKYAQSFSMLESFEFSAEILDDLQKSVKPDDKECASDAIFRLSTILKYMDSNLNLLVAILLNGLFMFNLHLLLKAEKWRDRNRMHVPRWFNTVAEFDALCSLANMSFNNPEFIFPIKADDDFVLEACDLGHPLIHSSQRVVNHLSMKGWNQFAIITGANMSGKSTFLRTVGVNLILAMMGAPVCAKSFVFYPLNVHSSVRTSDSLIKNESYFYAELKRLKQIIDDLKSGVKKLILLDEILKGTNSKDKQLGSIALIEQLLQFKSVGLFATHDLMLGELQNRFPEQVKNLCFEIEIDNDTMVIDYKLHDGVCKNLNATYLMKNMGILMN